MPIGIISHVARVCCAAFIININKESHGAEQSISAVRHALSYPVTVKNT